jgi:hypothetical protein
VPAIQVILYMGEDGSVPVGEWLQQIPGRPSLKCRERIEALERFGHEMLQNRNHAAYLRDDIYELRARVGTVNCRLLFFYGRAAAVVAHGLTK